MTNQVKAGLRIPAGQGSNYGLFKRAVAVFEARAQTWHIAQVLRARVTVFQSPAKFTSSAENIENMRYFFTRMNMDGFIFVGEQ